MVLAFLCVHRVSVVPARGHLVGFGSRHSNGCSELAHAHLGVGPGAVGAADFDVVAAGRQGGDGEKQLALGAGGKAGGGHLHGAAGAVGTK